LDDRPRFARSSGRGIEAGGHSIHADRIVLAKLEWAKIGASKRQIEDAAGILKIRSAELDRNYIEHWVQDLALQEQWLDALRIAGP